jgi:O-antigen ligase
MVGVGATIVGAIVGSSSRGALIGSSAALLWMLLRSQYKFRGLVSIGVLAAIVWRILPVEFYRRLSAMGDDPDSVSRLTYWKYGWELMKEHPLLGIGYQAWYDTYAAHVIATGDRHKPEVCHNIFIQAGSELGFPGLLMVVGLVLSTFVLNSRTRRVLGTEPNARFLRLISLGLDAAMVGFLVSAQFVTVLYYPYLWIQLALTVALYNVVRRRAEVAGAK